MNRAVGNYLRWDIPPNPVGRVDLSEDEWIDEWAVRWKGGKLDRGYIVDHPLKDPDLKALRVPKFNLAQRSAGMKEMCEENADLFLLAWCGDMFERAHFLRGMANLLVDMHEHPAFVHGLLDRCLEFCLAGVRMLAGFPVDAIILSDDYGQQTGALFSPRHFREFIKPRLRVLFEAIRKTGKRVALHSCGDVSLFVPDLLDVGLEILHPVQAEAMDVRRIKEDYGRDLCIIGGISGQRLLRFASPNEIRESVRRDKAVLARGGGYILAPNLDLTHDVPFENVLAFLEAARGN